MFQPPTPLGQYTELCELAHRSVKKQGFISPDLYPLHECPRVESVLIPKTKSHRHL